LAFFKKYLLTAVWASAYFSLLVRRE